VTETVKLRAHGKLNLYLTIGGTRPDGFHDLTSVFHAVDLADEITIMPRTGVTMSMEVPGDVDESANLATRALASLDATQVGIHITKRIPLAGGLGGGSADAAAVLLGTRDRLGLSISDEELSVIGATIGSDVPFFVHGAGTALVEGRGERVTGLVCPQTFWFVIGVSFTSLATGDVYRRWDELDGSNPASASARAMIDAVTSGDVSGVGALLHNDLEAAAVAIVPELASKKEALQEAGALGALVSGSGPTIFGLAAGPQHAQEMAEAASGLFDRVHVVASSLRSVQRVR
jgi:4-diphosphocytidyl-2-C-methyl-D-erythritol kinase